MKKIIIFILLCTVLVGCNLKKGEQAEHPINNEIDLNDNEADDLIKDNTSQNDNDIENPISNETDQNAEVKNPTDDIINPNEINPKNIPESILKGYSLIDLGLAINLEDLKEFTDPNTNNVLGYEAYHTSDMQIGDYNRFGNISILGINYSDNMISLEWMAALFLQGFKKPIETEIEHFIEVDSKFYSVEELKEYMLFEDDEFIVLDITDLLPIRSFNRSIEMLAERRPSYSYEWMIDVYNYLKSYEDINIVYEGNDT